MIGFIELHVLIEELFNVANLTGNAGKAVKRLMDRTFGPGLSVSLAKATAGTSALGFALYLRQLRMLISDLRALEGFDSNFTLDLVPKLSEGLGYVSVLLKAKSVPEGMRDRQALLRDGRDILHNFTYLEDLYLCTLTERFFEDYREARDVCVDDEVRMRTQVLNVFADLVRGDTTHARTEKDLYELARLLNPSLPDLDLGLAA